MDDNREFIDDIRFVYLDELHIVPKTENLIIFLSSSPELAKREQMSHVFKWCCLCLGHVVPKLSSVTLDKSSAEVELSDVFEPLQSFLLSSSAEQNIFYQCRVDFVIYEVIGRLRRYGNSNML